VTIDWNDTDKCIAFRVALEAVYFDYDELDRFVTERLGENLANISEKTKMSTVTFKLLYRWAKPDERKLAQLFAAFRAENPDHPVIKALEQQIFPTPESDQKVVRQGDQRAASSSLTASQRHRYQQRYDTLQSEFTLRFEKLSYLSKGLAIEVNPAIKFQLQKQVEEEEKQLEMLETELVEVEKFLQSG